MAFTKKISFWHNCGEVVQGETLEQSHGAFVCESPKTSKLAPRPINLNSAVQNTGIIPHSRIRVLFEGLYRNAIKIFFS